MIEAHGFFFLLCCAAALFLAGAQTGFTSIDCGLTDTASYIQPDGLTYVADDGFIDGGVNVQIEPDSLEKGTEKVYYSVRSFPDYKRNCYQLPVTIGMKYFVRAAFLYGNYDRLNQTPSFDLYLGADLWDTVNLTGNHAAFRTELVVQAKESNLSVCLVNTGHGKPFISGLKLWPLPESMYSPANSSLSLALKTFKRVDVGARMPTGLPDDPFDRIWESDYDGYGTPYNTTMSVSQIGQFYFGLPEVVMQTAVYSPHEIFVNWTGGVDDRFYLFLEFADILIPAHGGSRNMTILKNGEKWGHAEVYSFATSVFYSTEPVSASQNSFSIRPASASDELGAVLNSFEVYQVLTFNGFATDTRDVHALHNIKRLYNLKKNWMGDPCFPVFPWDGLTCDDASTPRILTLDLSNCGLNGTIAEPIFLLDMLKALNLSRNNLNGPVPAFLGDLQNLAYIDLSNNNLDGSIPPGLIERNKTGAIILRIDGNPNICHEHHCNQDEKGGKTIVVVSTVVSLIVATIILFLVITMIQRRKQGGPPQNNKGMVHRLLGPHASLGNGKTGSFSYSEVVKMTNNFEKVVGRGGSGTVFYGRLNDGCEVAVKKVSSKVVERGIKEFVTEVKMLMQVHHKYLVSFIGYCADENEMILIYEYMSKGNLHKRLLDETTDALNWRQRLQIAIDAAIGLEYLHSRCSPAFIHRDVKSSNILINEKFQAKVADFGLSKSVVSDEITHVTTAIAGTPGYLDPEYCYTNNVTTKSDVYGFGVVLFELITGRTAVSTDVEGQQVSLVQLVRPELKRGDIKNVIDPKLQGQYNMSSMQKVAEMAMTCTEEKSIARPTMTEVVAELKEAMLTETSRVESTTVAGSREVEVG